MTSLRLPRTHRLVLALAILAAQPSATCRRPPMPVAIDLVSRLPAADRWSSRETVIFGMPDAEPHLSDGFFREALREGKEPFAWSRRECEVSFTWPDVVARTAVIDMIPYRAVHDPSVKVSLNGRALEEFGLNDGRHRYRVALPAAAQRSGDNRLRFSFSSDASPAEAEGGTDRRRLAAAFYSLVVGRSDDPGVEALLARGAPSPFGTDGAASVPSFVVVGPSVVRYALLVPKDAELRFTPGLHPLAQASGDAASFRVTIEERAGTERELWSKVVSASERRSAEAVVPLSFAAGRIVRLAFHVGAASNGRSPSLWGVWAAPRILAPGGVGGASVPSEESQRKADTLRRGISGANVLLVVFDAGRADAFGCYGSKKGATPEVDRIAADGVVFDRAFTPAVYTLAAMSSMWTSQYPERHHADVSFSAGLPKDRLTLADVLSAQGIHTAGFVANQVAGAFNGFDRGFSEFHDLWRDHGSQASSFAKVMPAWFDGVKDKRFFAYVHFREPHAPYDPPPPYDTRFGPEGPIPNGDRSGTGLDDRLKALNQAKRPPQAGEIEHIQHLYAGNLAFADAQLGLLRRAMEERGLWERTTVIVTADHGEGLFEHAWIGHNTQVYEESVRVPLVVRFANGQGPRGARVAGLTDLLDVAPTVADLFGVLGKGGSDREFTGQSLLGAVHGAPGKPWVLSRTVWDRPVFALRDDRVKAIVNTRTGELRLFDLDADAGETTDVAGADELKTAYYRQTLQYIVSRLNPAVEGAALTAITTREQCESLKALGYLGASVKCP